MEQRQHRAILNLCTYLRHSSNTCHRFGARDATCRRSNIPIPLHVPTQYTHSRSTEVHFTLKLNFNMNLKFEFLAKRNSNSCLLLSATGYIVPYSILSVSSNATTRTYRHRGSSFTGDAKAKRMTVRPARLGTARPARPARSIARFTVIM